MDINLRINQRHQSVPHREHTRPWNRFQITKYAKGGKNQRAEMKARIDLQSWCISRSELAWKRSGFQSAKSCRAHHDRRFRRESDLDRWRRNTPRSGFAHSIKGGRVGGMLKLSGVDGPNEGNLEIDSGGQFSQIKLHILVVWELRHKDLAYQRLIS